MHALDKYNWNAFKLFTFCLKVVVCVTKMSHYHKANLFTVFILCMIQKLIEMSVVSECSAMPVVLHPIGGTNDHTVVMFQALH